MSDPAGIDYICNGCAAQCGGDVGGPAFVVSRETPEAVDECFCTLCARCWNATVQDKLGDFFLEPTNENGS